MDKKAKSTNQGAPQAGPQAQPATAVPGLEVLDSLLGRSGQLDAIVGKSLDLAETGLMLGLGVLSRFGALAQGQLVDKLVSNVAMGNGTASAAASAAEPAAEARGEEAAKSQADYVVNRLPVHPGGSFSISLSLNNDAAGEDRQVELTLDGFTGQRSGQHLEAKLFAVRPQRATIAPMDFEKFTLAGTVPAAVPPDLYLGWINVSGPEVLRIPVGLVVSPPPPGGGEGPAA